MSQRRCSASSSGCWRCSRARGCNDCDGKGDGAHDDTTDVRSSRSARASYKVRPEMAGSTTDTMRRPIALGIWRQPVIQVSTTSTALQCDTTDQLGRPSRRSRWQSRGAGLTVRPRRGPGRRPQHMQGQQRQSSQCLVTCKVWHGERCALSAGIHIHCATIT